MNGYNNSRFWDTAFMAQAALATGHPDAGPVLEKAAAFVVNNQITTELPDRARYYRDPRIGGWPFSDKDHGWPITDCTAEGITTSLSFRDHGLPAASDSQLAAAVERLLERQNEDGGWPSYERARTGSWIEVLNPSDAFSDIMIDYSYVECTAACLHALSRWDERHPTVRVRRAIEAGERFLRGAQRPDGSFFGSWAVCFTYGTWFALRGLRAAGASTDDPAVVRAVAFLVRIQGPDGGWGESLDACRAQVVTPSERSEPVMTAWALLALCEAGAGGSPSARRGAQWLRTRQREDGTWHQGAMTGVFNKTCSINYEHYRHYFPLWALAATRPP